MNLRRPASNPTISSFRVGQRTSTGWHNSWCPVDAPARPSHPQGECPPAAALAASGRIGECVCEPPLPLPPRKAG